MHDLIQVDQEIFSFINGTLKNDFLDWLMPILRNKLTWVPLYVVAFISLLFKFKKLGLIITLGAIITFGISDFTSSQLVKKTIERLRPCNDPDFREEVNLLVHCGSGYSFTSSHATNHFAIAFFFITLLGKKYKSLKWTLTIWAASIAIAQVYVGVHYPFDILCGALLGTLIGWSVGRILRDNIYLFSKNNF